MTGQPLPPSVWDLLKRLRLREDMGTCYLAHAGRGRAALVVPELRGDGPLARLTAYNYRTIRAAREAELITVTDLPAGEAKPFRYRSHLDLDADQAIALTDTGREAVR